MDDERSQNTMIRIIIHLMFSQMQKNIREKDVIIL